MMKFLVLLALVAFVTARPQQEVEVLRQESENDGAGNFKWVLETSDGVKNEQSGYIKNPEEQDPDKRIQVIQGRFTFLDRDTGRPITVTYIADENGYQPNIEGI